MSKSRRTYSFAIDFDGTLAEHVFPEIGKEIPLAVETCKELKAKGYKLFLNTVRSDRALQLAKDWCLERGLEFDGWNENPEQKSFSTSPKVYAAIYIDDAALGCPLIVPPHGRAYVNWTVVREVLKANGIL